MLLFPIWVFRHDNPAVPQKALTILRWTRCWVRTQAGPEAICVWAEPFGCRRKITRSVIELSISLRARPYEKLPACVSALPDAFHLTNGPSVGRPGF